MDCGSASERSLLGGIDGGGTTFKCGVVSPGGAVVSEMRIATTDPASTLAACAAFFDQEAKAGRPVRAIGIACFGPLDLDPASRTFGSIRGTPKAGWDGCKVAEELARLTDRPVALDTDVNGALLAERRWGAARGCASAAYVTVGTGVGAGLHVNGDLLGRPAHPEFGHIPVQRHRDDDYKGACSFHAVCLEGMVCAPAIRARFGAPEEMGPDHAGWDIAAFYLGQACRSLFLTVRLDRIVLGGGLMLAEGLLQRVRREFVAQMNSYVSVTETMGDALIRTPLLGDHAGILGAACVSAEAIASA